MGGVDDRVTGVAQEWDDALEPARQKLSKEFADANDKEGVFSLSEFSTVVRRMRGLRDDLSEDLIFKIYDFSLRMSEV